jgi:hypothetical protein
VNKVIHSSRALTGNPPVLVETGETFELLALRRASEAASIYGSDGP